jgi:acyl transferase domain-containing protein/acyl carrier protein
MTPIAIIGIGCRFANAADSHSFFELLKNRVDATRETPEDRWNLRSFYDADRRIPGKLSTARGGFLPAIDGFDAQFFGISPREAAYMDPQQRLMLEVAWEAMEDAGLAPERLAGTDVGVFAGAFTLDYKAIQLGRLNRHLIDAHTATGAMMTMVSNRISYIFDFRGPSMSIDTACSSSLVAVHLACNSLRAGECSLALAGGVNVMVTPEYTIAESKGGFLAPDGRSKPFSAAANGYGRAEGAGVVILKPLDRALADHDPIYAVIRGSAVNQDGRTNGITAPSREAQRRLIVEACRRAGVTPGEIQYVEAHGTGTPVGDPIEIGALADALGAGRAKDKPLLVGSVKGNIGHLEAGAGVAGLIKASLCLKRREIPPNLHFEEPNPAIPFDQLPLRVPVTTEPWPDTGGSRALAAVNSFGFGGTNAHVVLEEAPPATQRTGALEEAERPVLIPISARSPQALEAMARSMRDFARATDASLADIYYTAAFRRSHHDHRLAVVAGSKRELAALLDAHLAGETRLGAASGVAGARPRIAFVCTGMGPQWWAMGRRLFSDEPVFREMILRCDEIFRSEANWSLLMEMIAPEEQSRMAETQVAQTANFAIQVALAALWKSWGVEPDGIVGHSVGEVSAAYLSGALTLAEAIRVSFHRSRLQQTTAGSGAMMAVGLPGGEVAPLLESYGGRISIAAVNSPSSATVSGDPEAIQDLAARLEEKQVFHRALRVNVAYHSAQMDPLREELMTSLADLRPREAIIPLYSTVTGARAAGGEFGAAYWWRNVREPVAFCEAMDGLINDGYDCFLEVGPHPVLASSIHECLSVRARKASVLCSLRRGEDESTSMMAALGALYTIGANVNWEAFRSPSAAFVRLPAYPWQRERYWSESEESLRDRIGVAAHPLLGLRTEAARPTWQNEISASLCEYLADHAVRGAVVFPGAGYVEMAMAAAREVYGDANVSVEDIRFERALFLSDGERPKIQVALDPDTGAFEIHGRASGGGWIRHAAGSIRNAAGCEPPTVDIAAIERRCTAQLNHEQCYRHFAAQGFQYGPAFQKISWIRIGEGEALARFDSLDVAELEYRLHPAVLDACFQALVATDPFPSKTYLPVGIERIRVRRRPHGAMLAWARLDRRSEASAAGSIFLCDETGEVAVEIAGFVVKALDALESVMPDGQLERSLYEVRWTPAPRIVDEAAASDGRWLILAHANQAAASTLADTLGRYGCTVEVGDRVSDGFDGIVCFPAGAAGVMKLVQTVAASGVSTKIWLVTRGAQAAGEQKTMALEQAAAWGLGRVVGHQEHIGIWGGMIDLDPAGPEGEAEQIARELLQPTDEDQIAFRGGERYVARLERCRDLAPELPARFRADASYLITGGFGALGLLTARWMAERGARRIILMSRTAVPARERWNDASLSPETAKRIAAIRELESLGAAVMIAPVDVAAEVELALFLHTYEREGWPPIRGVVHSAGLVRDQLLLQMDEASFNEVLRPKAQGAWNLHRLLANAPLDFFVLYSSIGSLVAAAGQANYAAGNAFLDALAHYRRMQGLPALSINWGPWAVGMVNDLNLVEHYRARGLAAITPEQGMQFLSRLMSQTMPQAAVLTADWAKLFEFQPKVAPMVAHLAEDTAAGDASGAAAPEDIVASLLLAEPHEQGDLIEDHLRGLAARVLRMDREKIDAAQPLTALGLDSMMATELKNRIELSLHTPVSVLDLLKGVSLRELGAALLPKLLEENSDLDELLAEIEKLPPEGMQAASSAA